MEWRMARGRTTEILWQCDSGSRVPESGSHIFVTNFHYFLLLQFLETSKNKKKRLLAEV